MIVITTNDRPIHLTDQESKAIHRLLVARPEHYITTATEQRNRAFDAGFRIAMVLSKANAGGGRVSISMEGLDPVLAPNVIDVIEDLGPWQVRLEQQVRAA